MFRNKKEGLRFITLLMAIIMIAMVVLPAVPVYGVAANDTYKDKATITLNNIYNKFRESGKLEGISYSELDTKHVYILEVAKANSLNWEAKNGKKLETSLDELVQTTSSSAINADIEAKIFSALKITNKTSKADVFFDKIKFKYDATSSGAFGIDNLYVNLAVYDILDLTGKLIDLGSPEKAISYIITSQSADGSYGGTYEDFYNPGKYVYYPDFVGTLQAVRALDGLKEFANDLEKNQIDTAINSALVWVKELQQSDGSIFVEGDNPVVDTSEIITTIHQLGLKDREWTNINNKALTYLNNLSKNYYETQNVDVNARALLAFVLQGSYPIINQNTGSGGSLPKPPTDTIKVDVAVIDDEGKIIYGPKSVKLDSDDTFGLTALATLDKTRLDYDAGRNNDFVTDIEGIKNKGNSGWRYAVNGRTPGTAAINIEVRDGDEILWFYSKNPTSSIPNFPTEKDKETVKEPVKVAPLPGFAFPPKVTFPDVGANIPWAKEAIEVLAGRGIISGTGNGFEPNRSINRAEFAKLVVETIGNKSLNQGTGMFSDVDSSKWYADYIGKAFATGLIEGSNGKFRPMESITRNEVAVILHRMQNKVVPNNGIISFKDESSIPEWARLSVAYALERGLIKGYDDNTFKGDQPMTRAEVAVVLYRYIQMMNL